MDLSLPIQLAILAVFGLICSLIAHQRGRNPVGWFFIGAFLGCFGIILILVLPDLAAEQERMTRMTQRTRRLEERLTKERMIADQRLAEANRRLAVHDTALGLDTARGLDAAREVTPAIGHRGAAMSPPPLPPQSEVQRQWHYATMDAQEGPVSIEELRTLWARAELNPSSLVWKDGMPEWLPISDIPKLREALDV